MAEGRVTIETDVVFGAAATATCAATSTRRPAGPTARLR